MDKQFEKELKALAKKHGYEVLDECIYCATSQHGDGQCNHWMKTFSKEVEE